MKAIELFRRNGRYKLIFMDVNMPTMDGLEVTHVLRTFCSTLEPTKGQPVCVAPFIVGVSGDASQETEQACRAVGMDEISKGCVVMGDV